MLFGKTNKKRKVKKNLQKDKSKKHDKRNVLKKGNGQCFHCGEDKNYKRNYKLYLEEKVK